MLNISHNDLVSLLAESRNNLSDKSAIKYMRLYPQWIDCIGMNVTQGMIDAGQDKFVYNDVLYRAIKPHEIMEHYPPGLETASIYEAIDETHEGTIDDPIPYVPPMEIFEGLYYVESEVLYLCTRGSGQALTHNLSDLVGIYVNVV